ncbi:MAG: nucleotidyltransferase substrate binding protein [Spirochaeta sp.]
MNTKENCRELLLKYRTALMQLQEAVDLSRERQLSRLEQLGLIQCFQCTHEIAWTALAVFLRPGDTQEEYNPADILHEAKEKQLVSAENIWQDMNESRKLSCDSFNETTTIVLIGKICTTFSQHLKLLYDELEERARTHL